MAVSRGGLLAFWVACVRIHGRRQHIVTEHIRSRSRPIRLCCCPSRPLSSASRALASANCTRYQTVKQAVVSHRHVSWPQGAAYLDDRWEEPLGPCCALARPSEWSGLRTVVEIPLFGQTRLAEVPGSHQSADFSFLLTTVDGSREDDISIGGGGSFRRSGARGQNRQHSCFGSLFEAESCPAPFVYASRFYCFHSPGTDATAGGGPNSRQGIGLERNKMEEFPCHPHPGDVRTEGSQNERDNEGEQKLAVAYDRLRTELPNFFRKNHDYTMYSRDVEFINGLVNAKTRGRAIYRLSTTLWRLACLFYFTDVRLEVLKLTKHAEDGTIKARWRLRGLPFLTLMLRFYRKDKSHLYSSYDAFSTFYIGRDGLIHCHQVEKVMPAQPPALPRVTSLLASALVALGVEENRPALNLLPSLLRQLQE